MRGGEARSKWLLIFRRKMITRREIVCCPEGGLSCGGRVKIGNNTHGGKSFMLQCSCGQSRVLFSSLVHFGELALVFLGNHVPDLSCPRSPISLLPGLTRGV